MPARDVKAYVKCNKNDAADAEAICEDPNASLIVKFLLHREFSSSEEINPDLGLASVAAFPQIAF